MEWTVEAGPFYDDEDGPELERLRARVERTGPTRELVREVEALCCRVVGTMGRQDARRSGRKGAR